MDSRFLTVSVSFGMVQISDGVNDIIVEIEDCQYILDCISEGISVLIEKTKYKLHIAIYSDRLSIETQVQVGEARLVDDVEFEQTVIPTLEEKLSEVLARWSPQWNSCG